MPTKPGTYATFKTTQGNIVVELFEKDAPQTVANFIGLAEGTREWNSRSKKGAKLYDGTIFHRVIPNFMIQGGDPEGTGMGGPGYKFADETKGSPHGFQKPGKLAMANAGPNTNGSQFFITVTDTSWLTGKHTIFGEVVEGYDIVEKISHVPTASQDKPRTPVVLESVTIERVGEVPFINRRHSERAARRIPVVVVSKLKGLLTERAFRIFCPKCHLTPVIRQLESGSVGTR